MTFFPPPPYTFRIFMALSWDCYMFNGFMTIWGDSSVSIRLQVIGLSCVTAFFDRGKVLCSFDR